MFRRHHSLLFSQLYNNPFACSHILNCLLENIVHTRTHIHTHSCTHTHLCAVQCRPFQHAPLPYFLKSTLDQREEVRSRYQESVDSLRESIQEMKEEQATVLQEKRRKEKAHKSKLVSGPREGED